MNCEHRGRRRPRRRHEHFEHSVVRDEKRELVALVQVSLQLRALAPLAIGLSLITTDDCTAMR